MKARIKIAAMLMSMIIGTLAASAQSAQRGTPHSDNQRKSSSTVTNRTQTANKSKDARSKTQKTDVRQDTKRQSTPARTTQRNGNAYREQQKVSTTTHHNPRSNYREPNKTVHVGKTRLDPKNQNTYNKHNQVNRGQSTVVHHKNYNNSYSHSNNYDHRHYPHAKVKIHVHPMTYNNHYKAMYYPSHREIVWTRRMHNKYIGMYPGYNWRYPTGYRIQTISSFDARYNVGEVSRVYGRVYGTWYNKETDDLLLFFGGEYPNQHFTIILPGRIARRHNWRPERYFLGQHVMATGLITTFEGNPEMVIKEKYQLDLY